MFITIIIMQFLMCHVSVSLNDEIAGAFCLWMNAEYAGKTVRSLENTCHT